jgi:hypothetical protein
MTQVEILSEEEESGGWTFVAQLLDDEGMLHQREIRLAWVDYNLWSKGGADAPARVASAVLEFLLTRLPPEDIRKSMDASIARRLYDDADMTIPTMI